MLKSAVKIQDQRLDQKFATSERKQQEKWPIIQIFRDNFSGFETNRKPSKVLLDASETHIMWKNSCHEMDTLGSNRLQSG